MIDISLFWLFVGAVIGLSAGISRGFNPIGSFFGGALAGPFAILMFWMDGLVSSNERRVQCPFCAEMILPKAIVCKHCHHTLPTLPANR